MLSMLKDWQGKVEINDKEYEDIQSATIENKALSGQVHIKLYSNSFISKFHKDTKRQEEINEDIEHRFTVKAYMTKPATLEFDFMAKWNDNNPMPMRIMEGVRVKETPGMVYLKLHGLAKPTITCYCCGKELTNPISRKYGVGPICLSKMGIDLDIEDVENIKEQLVNIEWSGWCIRSAILSEEEV